MDVPGYAIITGAGSGIGRACAHTFARDGAAGLALLDINLDALANVKAEIDEQERQRQQQYQHHHNHNNHHHENGYHDHQQQHWEQKDKKPCQVYIYSVNVKDENQVEQVVKKVVSKFDGRIDYLINAAGIAMKHPGGAAYVDTSDWQNIIDINLTGTLFMLREVVKIMLKQEPIRSIIDGRPVQRGSIVNFASIQGLVGIPLSTAYAVSKHGVIGLTKSASEDYADQGLRINSICPGYTETPMTTKSPLILKAMEEKVGNVVPMKRMGKAQEIADGVVWLAGGRSSFVTGISLSVDGGYTQR